MGWKGRARLPPCSCADLSGRRMRDRAAAKSRKPVQQPDRPGAGSAADGWKGGARRPCCNCADCRGGGCATAHACKIGQAGAATVWRAPGEGGSRGRWGRSTRRPASSCADHPNGGCATTRACNITQLGERWPARRPSHHHVPTQAVRTAGGPVPLPSVPAARSAGGRPCRPRSCAGSRARRPDSAPRCARRW